MTSPGRRRELGRGERVLPGISRLRLPLPWPGVPHCNAYAVAAADGIVLFDCGLHEPDSLAQLERAMAQVNLSLADVRLLVCTHAHSDHYGQAASVIDASGCELWMHPDHAHMRAQVDDPDALLARRFEVARQSGVPVDPLRAWSQSARERGSGIARLVEPDRELVAGVTVDSELGIVDGRRDPGARALARLPAPARAAPADLRRPSARPCLAVLRLRLDARPRRRVRGLAGPRRGARRAPLPRRPRTHVHRRARPHRRQPRARRRAPGARPPGRRRARPDQRLRRRAAACMARS